MTGKIALAAVAALGRAAAPSPARDSTTSRDTDQGSQPIEEEFG